MTDAIRLIQGVTTPTQVNRIVDWNKERNNFELDSNLEINMLAEEAKEYFEADNIVDRMDAVCDLIFVAVGTLTKSANAYHLAAKEIFSPIDFILSDFVGRVQSEGITGDNFMPMLGDCLDAVISANESKGTEKDENGKVKKPEGFVPPEETIARIIAGYKSGRNDTEEVFKGGEDAIA